MRLAMWAYMKRSVCPCGFSILLDDVPLGKTYTVDADSVGPGTLICGGCGEMSHIPMVMVQDQERGFFLLPAAIFIPSAY